MDGPNKEAEVIDLDASQIQVHEASQPMPTKLLEVDQSDYVETFVVREKNKKFKVAANAIANKALMQINVARLRVVCEKTLEIYEGVAPSAKELKALVDAFATVNEMSEAAYGQGAGGQMANALERTVYAMTRAVADVGASKVDPNSHTPTSRLNRMRQLGRATEKRVAEAKATEIK